jgi:hypothetical protein
MYRPRQNYVGYGRREFIEFSERKEHNHKSETILENDQKRRDISKKY